MGGVRAILASLILTVGGAGAACDGNGVTELPPDPTSSGSGTTLPEGGTVDADAGVSDAPPDRTDADAAPVRIGVTANARGDASGGPTSSGGVEATLITLAAGVRGAVVSRAWRDLEDGEALLELSGEVSLYTQHDIPVLFNLALVDRAADGRSDALAGVSWTAPEAILELELTLDAVISSFGSSLRYLTLGRDLDRYLALHPEQRESLSALAVHGCDYARTHPDAPEGLEVGVAFSFEGVAAPDPSFEALLEAGTIAAVSYFPGLEPEEPPSAIAASLDAMIAAVGDKPIVLQAIGAPSSGQGSSSEESQRQFYASFFEALAPRRDFIPWVNAFHLHDRSPSACEAYAAAQGEELAGTFALASCSLGLFTAAATPKSAWAEVLKGTATFASP